MREMIAILCVDQIVELWEKVGFVKLGTPGRVIILKLMDVDVKLSYRV